MAPQVGTCDDCHLSLFRPTGWAPRSGVPLPVRAVDHLAAGSELRHFAPDDRLNDGLRRESTWLGSPGVSGASGRPLGRVGARQRFIHVGRPRTNGCVERVQGTILEECWKPSFARRPVPKQTGLRRDHVRYLDSYNADRAHTGRWTRGRTPESVIGKARLWS